MWTGPLAPMPLGTMGGGSVEYKGQLYCLGGFSSNSSNNPVNDVQIYQP